MLGIKLPSWLLSTVFLLPFQQNLNDFRVQKLERFFDQTPLQGYSQDFVDAADQYHLDWRLLPAISMVESTGGKHCRNYNPFGWGSGRARFESYQDAIFSVARHLSEDNPYRGKTTTQKIRAYNARHWSYPSRVHKMIDRIWAERQPSRTLSRHEHIKRRRDFKPGRHRNRHKLYRKRLRSRNFL